MSYQVLARKWRPRSFEDMVGQAHVVRALTNALDQGRLHHAYLFTGTRGVGKTTLARILSKALNCEQGISSHPCGQCGACREIDEGRFVDLLEVDAASRTKVDQTRELLDNVPFAPVSGRYKVYLIDEVHMFSASSFNALLKTLEEPPAHVKFLLATTDPQKVPMTVLSRCLQFNLKRLIPAEIHRQLARILETEGIAFEERALGLLAQAADGSMRDGLSLLDQAISFGAGRVVAQDVRAMLGTVDRDFGLGLLRALAGLDGAKLLDEVARIHELTPDFSGVLKSLLAFLHRIALYQQVPTALADDDADWEHVKSLARDMSPEDVQLFYQIALQGQQDIPLAPDPRTGMEMVLLRMLAFRPSTPDGAGSAPLENESGGMAAPSHRRRLPVSETGAPADRSLDPPASQRGHPAAALAAARLLTGTEQSAPPRASNRSTLHPEPPGGPGLSPLVAEPGAPYPGVREEPAPTSLPAPQPGFSQGCSLRGAQDWQRLLERLDLGGVASQLAGNCELGGWDGRQLLLTLDPASQGLRVPIAEQRLREALARELGKGLRLEIRIARPEGETPAQGAARKNAERRAAAVALMDADPVARAMHEELGARFLPGTIGATDALSEGSGENT
jgi:DNA polymerase-3 subunit gamma/tau